MQFGPLSGMIHTEGSLGRRKIRIAPSILAADFGRLAEQVSEADRAMYAARRDANWYTVGARLTWSDFAQT